MDSTAPATDNTALATDNTDSATDNTTPDSNQRSPVTAKLPRSVQHMRENLSLLELEFAEFRVLTLDWLTEASLT
ncbi:hypothetical protein EOD39_2332 [Acipenser ruthenus]|uniref:Uncharacterized protein n=1 Tax=Acipenser ruthenus TaxID=7906 RepID=A0A444U266_ACIRT|nr:hypothetical protein EOD39_2332 [Acipenser ruthenus]